jgi:hypothetical protein
MLKTSCNNCIFLENTKCKLDKETVLYDRLVVTEGFCNQKRPETWLKKNNDQVRPILDKINQDENNISSIIICKNKDKSSIIKTIKSCLKSPHIKQIVLSGYCLEINLIKELITFLSDKGIKWSIDNNLEDFQDDIYYIDGGVSKSTEEWCVVLDAGDEVSVDSMSLLKQGINTKNIIMSYIDNKIAFNRFAFLEMEGNLEMPWIDKLKTFSNWENSCLIIK